MPEPIEDAQNIYRVCRMRANDCSENKNFSSREKAVIEFSGQDTPMSAASLKDYESGKTIPHPDTVLDMSRVYGTPELKWMHCSRACPIGKTMPISDAELGVDDIYHTYFELAGSFDKVNEIEQRLHKIIDDNKLSQDEVPMMKEILQVMDRITENAKDLRVWCEKEGINLDEER